VVAVAVDELLELGETESCRSCRRDGELPKLSSSTSPARVLGLCWEATCRAWWDDEVLGPFWEATTYWRTARCWAGEVRWSVLPAGDRETAS
jgi:hypothetical protein